jgi:hypothetical protein
MRERVAAAEDYAKKVGVPYKYIRYKKLNDALPWEFDIQHIVSDPDNVKWDRDCCNYYIDVVCACSGRPTRATLNIYPPEDGSTGVFIEKVRNYVRDENFHDMMDEELSTD